MPRCPRVSLPRHNPCSVSPRLQRPQRHPDVRLARLAVYQSQGHGSAARSAHLGEICTKIGAGLPIFDEFILPTHQPFLAKHCVRSQAAMRGKLVSPSQSKGLATSAAVRSKFPAAAAAGTAALTAAVATTDNSQTRFPAPSTTERCAADAVDCKRETSFARSALSGAARGIGICRR